METLPSTVLLGPYSTPAGMSSIGFPQYEAPMLKSSIQIAGTPSNRRLGNTILLEVGHAHVRDKSGRLWRFRV